ncbi:MAG TPA: adenosylmethionine--8-amino-7-oxononanoate transaminase [Gammaproteobacteria bacterium]|nr:adenosylmethionine--8-amino-7-oxononanoate transaminase [Gammaproteobacteria bacterium]
MAAEVADWSARDLAVLWHPCTQMKDHEWLPLPPIARGEGAWLYDFEGRRYLDAISSWWVNLFGHGNAFIAGRIAEQAHTLEQVIFAGATHRPAIELAERLVTMAPEGLGRCFYADIGSAAVEVALKMSFHYWRNAGRGEKHRFVALANGYHGETLGALGVCDVDLYKEVYRPLLHEAIMAPSPDAWLAEPGESAEDFARRRFAAMEAILAARQAEIAAVILEPLVQCAGNMRMYHPAYLALLREACDRYGVHLIADEIAVGFGRTGTMFACEQAAIAPDFLLLSKGITGGFLPLAAVLTREEIYRAFYDDYRRIERAFLHSHSYTGNPLACAAANATLDLFAESDVLGANRERAAWLAEEAAALRDHPHVGEVRQRGMILAMELVRRRPREAYPWQERRGLRVYQYGLAQECWLRALGDVVYWMPPYVISREEAAHLGRVTRAAIDEATRD